MRINKESNHTIRYGSDHKALAVFVYYQGIINHHITTNHNNFQSYVSFQTFEPVRQIVINKGN